MPKVLINRPLGVGNRSAGKACVVRYKFKMGVFKIPMASHGQTLHMHQFKLDPLLCARRCIPTVHFADKMASDATSSTMDAMGISPVQTALAPGHDPGMLGC